MKGKMLASVLALCLFLGISAADFTLHIYGNADMDDVIDEIDIEYARGIMDGTQDMTDLADVNGDGKVDDEDIRLTEEIINGTATEIKVIDSDGNAVAVKVPVDDAGALAAAILRLLDDAAERERREAERRHLIQPPSGLDPDAYRGKVVVATMHKAKGLEWDKVYLMSVNDYDFPSAMPQDTFISESWFVRDSLNLEAEALAQLKALYENPDFFFYDEGLATLHARHEYAAERLRLFYVGITRARRELTVTWNTGQRGTSQPAVPFIALQTWWEQQKKATTEEIRTQMNADLRG